MTDVGSTAGLQPAAGPAAMLDTPASESLAWPLRGTRAWFACFLVWMIGLAALAVYAFENSYQGYAPAIWVWLLALMCFYLSLCNIFVPLPTAWIILLAASPDFAPLQAGWVRVVAVAGLSTLATVVANLNEYHLLAYLFHFGLGRRLRRTKLYGWASRWFDNSPFQLLTLIAFVPIPIDAVRWLAVLRGYSRVRFTLAYLLGRGPRYLLFAWCSVLLELRVWEILAIQAGLLGVAIVARLLWQQSRQQEQSQR